MLVIFKFKILGTPGIIFVSFNAHSSWEDHFFSEKGPTVK